MHKPLLALALAALLTGPALSFAQTKAGSTPAKEEGKSTAAKDARSEKAEVAVPFHGAWTGRFSGDSLGNIKVEVTEDGIAKVNCVIDDSKREFNLDGPVEPSGNVTAIEKSFGPAGIKVQFKGKLTHKGTAAGTWENAFFGLKGTWEATRIASK